MEWLLQATCAMGDTILPHTLARLQPHHHHPSGNSHLKGQLMHKCKASEMLRSQIAAPTSHTASPSSFPSQSSLASPLQTPHPSPSIVTA